MTRIQPKLMRKQYILFVILIIVAAGACIYFSHISIYNNASTSQNAIEVAKIINSTEFKSVRGEADTLKQYIFHDEETWYVCKQQQNSNTIFTQVSMYAPDRTYIYTIYSGHEIVYDEPHHGKYSPFLVNPDKVITIEKNDETILADVKEVRGSSYYVIDKQHKRVISVTKHGISSTYTDYDRCQIPNSFWNYIGEKCDKQIINKIINISSSI